MLQLLDRLADEKNGLPLSSSDITLARRLQSRGFVRSHASGKFQITSLGRSQIGLGLTDKDKAAIRAEVVMLLHASRDCLRNQGQDTSKVRFSANDGYYGEAFGILRALAVLHMDTMENLKEWLRDLEHQVLLEEHFGGSNECDHCLEHYGKDGAGRSTR